MCVLLSQVAPNYSKPQPRRASCLHFEVLFAAVICPESSQSEQLYRKIAKATVLYHLCFTLHNYQGKYLNTKKLLQNLASGGQNSTFLCIVPFCNNSSLNHIPELSEAFGQNLQLRGAVKMLRAG